MAVYERAEGRVSDRWRMRVSVLTCVRVRPRVLVRALTSCVLCGGDDGTL